jgi:hypothetical protein
VHRLPVDREDPVELETLFGLPAHPLVVHVPVVVIPLASVALVVAALLPRWRLAVGIPAAVAAVVSAIAVQLAAGTGEALEEALDEDPLIERHAGMADGLEVAAWTLAVAAVAFVAWAAWQRRTASGGSDQRDLARRWVAPVLAGLLVVSSTVATIEVVRVGHSGARAAWEDTEDGERATAP